MTSNAHFDSSPEPSVDCSSFCPKFKKMLSKLSTLKCMDQKLVVTVNIYEMDKLEAFFQCREFSAGFPKEPLK